MQMKTTNKQKFHFPVGYQSFHKKQLFNFQLNRPYSFGYARFADMKEVGQKIKTFTDWKKEMLLLAEKATADERFMNAAFYYRAAEFYTISTDPEKEVLYDKFIELFNKAFKKDEIEKHKVDDCLIKGEAFKKCDWLAVVSEKDIPKKEIYIELKGNDVSYALEQLTASIEKLSNDLKAKKLGYIICTRSPLSAAEIQIKTKQVLHSHSLMLRVKTIKHTETIEKLIADLTD